jgi:hypothetical protein
LPEDHDFTLAAILHRGKAEHHTQLNTKQGKQTDEILIALVVVFHTGFDTLAITRELMTLMVGAAFLHPSIKGLGQGFPPHMQQNSPKVVSEGIGWSGSARKAHNSAWCRLAKVSIAEYPLRPLMIAITTMSKITHKG